MFHHEVSAFSIFTLLFLIAIVLPGCAITNPSKNSFQATIQVSEWDFKADRSGEFYEMEDECKPGLTEKENAFVLIHGIYGGEDTFGRLQDELTFDLDLAKLGPSSVYLMEYWSNQFFPNFQSLSELGQAFKKRIEELVNCKHPKTIIIIAHSQGGIIAKEAVLSWKEIDDNKSKDILKKTKLVLIGTPNYFSTYAAYNNLIVNSIFAPITWVTGIISAPLFGKAFVYNRQAFDMADDINPARSLPIFGNRPGLFHPKFMLNHIAKWAEHFPSGVGVKDAPKIYAIVGVKDLFDDFALSDGIVHSDTLLFAGIPAQRVHYVPYQHFDGVASVDAEHHRTFIAIKKIVMNKEERIHNAEQQLSPFQGFSYARVTFVMERNWKTDSEENAGESMNVELGSIFLEGEKPLLEDFGRRAKTSLSGTFLRFIAGTVLFPFEFLMNLAYPVANLAEEIAEDTEPKWKIIRLPETVIDGDHEGIIEVSNKETGWWLGMFGTEYGRVQYRITDDPNDQKADCEANYPIVWESSTTSSLPNAKKNITKIKIQRNAVNYIKVELANDAIKLTREGCKQENMESGMIS